MVNDADRYIRELEAENHQLLTKVQQFERERDAAVSQLKGKCWACKSGKPIRKGSNSILCEKLGGLRMNISTGCPHWEWNEGKEQNDENR